MAQQDKLGFILPFNGEKNGILKIELFAYLKVSYARHCVSKNPRNIKRQNKNFTFVFQEFLFDFLIGASGGLSSRMVFDQETMGGELVIPSGKLARSQVRGWFLGKALQCLS